MSDLWSCVVNADTLLGVVLGIMFVILVAVGVLGFSRALSKIVGMK